MRSCLLGLLVLAGGGSEDAAARGKALLERRDFEGAAAAFEEAIAAGAAGEDTFLGAGRAARGAGRNERALEAFLTGLSRVAAPSSELNFEAGRTLEDLDRDESAAKHYEEALAIRPEHVPSLVALGVLRSRAGNLEDALRLLESAASREPGSLAARHNLAVVKARRGDLDGALAQYAAAAAIDPREAKVRHGMGTVLEKLGRNEEAIRELEKAAALDPEYPPPLWRLSSILFRLGRREEGARHLERFRELKARVHVRKAGQLARARDWSGAVRELERALDAGGDTADVHGRLGLLHLQAGDPERAALHARRAADLEPTAARFANLSWALARKGDREESLRWIDRAIELAPERKELRDQRARILESTRP